MTQIMESRSLCPELK